MKKIIKTDLAPAPIGPYNQAVMIDKMLFTSGQIALNPADGSLYSGGNIQEETDWVMKNLKAVLEAANMTFENVVKTTIFLMDMNQFVKVNEIYAQYFNDETAPARETVQVAGLPRGVQIEISMIAQL